MEVVLFIGALILAFIGIPIGIALLLYFVPRKLGYPKTAKYLTIIYGLIVLTIVFLALFEDQLFTKSDAKKLVEEQNIQLRDKFDLINNSSSSAIGDYYHTFTLKISESDKQEAIKTIRNSKDFQPDEKLVDSVLYLRNDRYFGPKIIQNYQTDSSYVREYFQPSGQQGNAPTYRRISISKTKSELTFEDIDE